MPKAYNDPAVIRMLRQWRLSLIAREDNQIKRLAKEWMKVEQSLSDEMLLLALQISDAKASGSIITEQLISRMSRYEQLQKQMKAQIDKYNKNISIPDIEDEQYEFGASAIKAATDAIKMSMRLAPSFDRLPVDAVNAFVGHLGDGTPLNRLLKEAYPYALDGVIKQLIEGTAKGLNPNQVASEMSKSLGMGLERITLIARTEQLRVARLVSAQQYRDSGLDGVMKRVATKDDRVCMACLVSDGEIIPLEQELDDHPRGRCCAVFQIARAPVINWEKGPDWFISQDASLQRQMMGDDKWQAWQDGLFKLSDLRQNAYSPIWGTSPRVASLKELLNGKTFISAPKPPPIKTPPVPDIIDDDKFALGTPVSDFLPVKIKDKTVREEVELALREIDKIHGLGNNPLLHKIVIEQTGRGDAYGTFWSIAGKGDRITINYLKSDHAALTTIHEIGHFLDMNAFPRTGFYIYSSMTDTQFGEIIKTAYGSKWWKNFNAKIKSINADRDANGYERVSKKFIEYIKREREILARAYAQYIAIESGDATLINQLRRLQVIELPVQWDDEDFEPIRAEFNKLFKELGWKK